MKKKESTLFNMILALGLVTIISGIALAYVYDITKEPIAKAKLAKKLKAIREVIPTFSNNPSESSVKIKAGKKRFFEFYRGEKDGKHIGTAVKTFTPNGFSGMIWIMMGILPDGTIYNTAVLEHKETPGLGTKMSTPKFKDQFKGKKWGSFNFKVTKDGGQVDAITAATISSRAFSDAIERGFKAYMKWKKKQAGSAKQEDLAKPTNPAKQIDSAKKAGSVK